jgi:threonine aldolase
MIDLRSDTVTRPTAEMRQAIFSAEVGDDVIDVDPTVERLQQKTAELLGKEASLYMPSGSMTNQIAIRIHCGRGDEFICEEGSHIFNYEQGAYAQLSGLAARTVIGTAGVLGVDDVADKIRPINEHMVRTRLLCLENTHNRAGGTIQPYDTLVDVTSWARSHGLQLHLDGARLFNAVVATGIDASTWAQHFDSLSVCFSKGLGAPVGSALAGSAEFIQQARHHRKLFGGGMRQAGIIAAAALYALENNIDRLKEDHANAQLLAEAVRQADDLSLVSDEVETNIIMFSVDTKPNAAAEFVGLLRDNGVSALALGPSRIRLVTHLDVSAVQAQEAAETLRRVASTFASGHRAAG